MDICKFKKDKNALLLKTGLLDDLLTKISPISLFLRQPFSSISTPNSNSNPNPK